MNCGCITGNGSPNSCSADALHAAHRRLLQGASKRTRARGSGSASGPELASTAVHRGVGPEAAHVQRAPSAVGVEGELWQPAARGSRWVCRGGQTSGWDRVVRSFVSDFIRKHDSLPLEDYRHANKEIVYWTLEYAV